MLRASDLATRGEPEGTLRIMVNLHPFEFIDRGDTILLRTERNDIERVIHIDVAARPAAMAATRLDFEVVVDDPAVFGRPARIEGCWLALGEEIARFDCEPSIF